MSHKRISLQEAQRLYSQDLARCNGYLWHLGTRIGKGSFGEVYLGWTSDAKEEVAVKAVSKSYFKQDPKVRENLEREIRIMKLLRNCEYVVHLHHVQDMKQHIVLVMELCEYDLDHLVKVSPFREDDITLFLFQLAQGMKALREQNIVHRDLKPGNILIKKDPVTGKMKIKLADFGFARHFTEEGTKKPVDMHSLAGTPVFMAPEALRCVFYPGEHYDDKVDIWSIGALLYKVIVGQCGFYAQLQDIPKILKHKKEAIAFERSGRNVVYIHELPEIVHDRLSPEYRSKMNGLLKQLLKLDPQDRMNFPEFFEFVEDLIHHKIEVINLLQGTSHKIIYDGGMTLDHLKTEIQAQLKVSISQQLIFSPCSPHSITPHSHPSPEQFAQLMEKCGASRGNGVLYLLPINSLQGNDGAPDSSCLAELRLATSSESLCVELITDHKFTNEMVRAINLLQSQQTRQLNGVKEFREFCDQELNKFRAHGGYQEALSRGLQTAARASLAVEWLSSDLEVLSGVSVSQEQSQTILRSLKQQRTEINKLVVEMETLYRASEKASQEKAVPDMDLTQPAALIKDAKKLPDLRRVDMFSHCKNILQKSEQLLKQSGMAIRHDLFRLLSSLSAIWSIVEKGRQLSVLCSQTDKTLAEEVPPIRSTYLFSLTQGGVGPSVSSPPSTHPPPTVTTPVATPNPPVVVTPPGWTRPPPGSTAFPASPAYPAQGQVAAESKQLASLREERDQYESLLRDKAEECAQLTSKNAALLAQLSGRKNSGSISEEEKTLLPGLNLRPSTPTTPTEDRPSLNPSDVKVFENLSEQLKSFCHLANTLKPGVASPVNDQLHAQSSPLANKAGAALYPDLDDYSIINVPGKEGQQNSERGAVEKALSQDNVTRLIPQANQLIASLKNGMQDLTQTLKPTENTVTAETSFIKLAKPKDYLTGDIVLFHPVKLPHSKVTVPSVMHTEKPFPYVFMDKSSYSSFGFRPGRIADLAVGQLQEKPRQLKFDEDPEMKQEFGEKLGGEVFYRVKVKPTPFRFTPQKGPYRPPSPKGLKFMRLPGVGGRDNSKV